MSKYIKLEDAISKMDEWFCEPYTPTQLLSDLPTIDIVHCEECKRCLSEEIEETMPIYIYCDLSKSETEWDSYCSCGERIEG